MEVIEVSSYTENEKLHIATEHLIPKQLERHGLTKEQLTISKGVIWKIAQNYTKEAGVRQMERESVISAGRLPERSMNMIKREFR